MIPLQKPWFPVRENSEVVIKFTQIQGFAVGMDMCTCDEMVYRRYSVCVYFNRIQLWWTAVLCMCRSMCQVTDGGVDRIWFFTIWNLNTSNWGIFCLIESRISVLDHLNIRFKSCPARAGEASRNEMVVRNSWQPGKDFGKQKQWTVAVVMCINEWAHLPKWHERLHAQLTKWTNVSTKWTNVPMNQ